MDQNVSLGQVIFKNCAPIFNRVPRLSPQVQQMFNADGTLQMMNSQEVIGTKYNLSANTLATVCIETVVFGGVKTVTIFLFHVILNVAFGFIN